MQKGNEGRKEATPTQTLTTPWETGQDILSRQDIPLQRRSSRELKAALGGKGAGVKAALTAQPEKKSQCTYPYTEPNTHAHSTPLGSKANTGSMHTPSCSTTHWLMYGLPGRQPSEGTQGLGLQLQVLCRLHSSPGGSDSDSEVCVLRATFLFPFGRLSPPLVRLGELATN